MGIEEGPITPSAADQRWNLIDSILKEHVPFPSELSYARSIPSRVYVAKHSVWGRKHLLTPVAFGLSVFATMIGATTYETIQPYLYVTLDKRLVYRSERRFYFVRDPLVLSDDDIDRLRLGVQGDHRLIIDGAERDRQRVSYALSLGINIPSRQATPAAETCGGRVISRAINKKIRIYFGLFVVAIREEQPENLYEILLRDEKP